MQQLRAGAALGADDSDDFETKAAATAKLVKEHVLQVSAKWQSSDLVKAIQRHLKQEAVPLSVQVLDTGPDDQVSDMELPSVGVSVLLVSELEYVGGSKAYRTRAARFFAAAAKKGGRPAVVVQRSEMSSPDFADLQKFIAVELGLPVIPLSSLVAHFPQLLVQLLWTGVKKNPFRFGAMKNRNCEMDNLMLSALKTVPGLDDMSSAQLARQFSSLLAVAEASEAALNRCLDKDSARAVYNFFHSES